MCQLRQRGFLVTSASGCLVALTLAGCHFDDKAGRQGLLFHAVTDLDGDGRPEVVAEFGDDGFTAIRRWGFVAGEPVQLETTSKDGRSLFLVPQATGSAPMSFYASHTNDLGELAIHSEGSFDGSSLSLGNESILWVYSGSTPGGESSLFFSDGLRLGFGIDPNASDGVQLLEVAGPDGSNLSNDYFALLPASDWKTDGIRFLLVGQHLWSGNLDVEVSTATYTVVQGPGGEGGWIDINPSLPSYFLLYAPGGERSVELCRWAGGSFESAECERFPELGSPQIARLVKLSADDEPWVIVVDASRGWLLSADGELEEILDWSRAGFVAVADVDGDGLDEVIVERDGEAEVLELQG